MSWTQHIKHPSQVVAMGQIIEAVILSLDKDEKKISLGIKQLEPDPWESLMQKYPNDSRHTGIARNLTNFGVFVELEPGVDGLVHISDLSWTKKIRHPGEVVKKGESIEVIVLGVDVEQRKISLGHKQIITNPWDTFEQKYSVDSITEGKVVRIIEKGLIIELPDQVDGFVPATQLSTSKIKNVAIHFPIDDVIPLKVLEFDKENKKIVLSAIAALKDKSEDEIQEYLKVHKLERVSVQSIKSSEAGAIDSSEFPIFEIRENESSKLQKTELKKEAEKTEE
jgi:small subunit ribosomal protein S1